MEDLPKVFKNTIEKEINNSQDRVVINEENSINVNDILSKDKYSFNHKYKIKLSNGIIIEDSIIEVLSDKVLTIDNGWIGVDSIKNIIEIKK